MHSSQLALQMNHVHILLSFSVWLHILWLRAGGARYDESGLRSHQVTHVHVVFPSSSIPVHSLSWG